ncbi:MAG: DUF1365 family protein [Alphaproteobacteria bacterium]|jgi:DUF1365 family protein|nr:DUF1365 family protein [Alphaproteobacteria bacterium]
MDGTLPLSDDTAPAHPVSVSAQADTGPAEPPAALYVGRVMHRRLIPFGHRFDYRVVSLWIDVDRIAEAAAGARLFGHGRFGPFGFTERDHGPRDGGPLRPWVERLLAERGIDLGGGTIRLLCFPRVLGFVFNPLSIFFCHHADGRLVALIHQVHNTFGEQHAYVLPVDPDRPDGAPIVQRCGKVFHVSPFIGMESTYRFRVKQPDAHLSVLIRQAVPEGELLLATLTGERAPLDDRTLARLFVTHPLMSLKVIGAIHWQAWKLWRKGARFHRHPGPPAEEASG